MNEHPQSLNLKKNSPNSKKTTSAPKTKAFTEEQLGHIVYMQPVIPDQQNLFITFPVEDLLLIKDEETGAFPYILSFFER